MLRVYLIVQVQNRAEKLENRRKFVEFHQDTSNFAIFPRQFHENQRPKHAPEGIFMVHFRQLCKL